MARTHGLWTTGALIVCLLGTQWSGTLRASEGEPPPAAVVSITDRLASTAEPSSFSVSDDVLSANQAIDPAIGPIWRSALRFVPVESSAYEQRGRRGGRGGRNDAAQTAVILGAVAAIAGAAVLVYANRPDCGTNQMASGCGYGTKVVGTAVLTGGIVSLVAGALTWRR
jgi:hypothetical protein